MFIGEIRGCVPGLWVLALDREQFDVENQRGIRADLAARTALAIGQVRGNKELPLRSYRHELQGFRPSLDDLTDREGRGLAALV
jgi:hypothetical protein